ncbi:hypothetical protein E2562_010883 [Oryza meyeriana var. granulata]|uniref:Cytochrome P450 n=1 Tax=Oryza meyeriana var. granulata TaxID=110450 RepID=A0A6G1BVL8_9ORYZ|nr:hypothetical protein E2562_010883 [Oryza meyeriana var. granulata]
MTAMSMSMASLQAPEFLASCLLLLATILLFKQLPVPSSKKRAASPPFPRPRGLPLIGNLHLVGALPHRSLAALAARHAAPLMLLRLGSVPTLVVSSADATRALFRDNDRALSGRPALYAATRLSYGHKSISFAPDGAYWRAARRACLSELLVAPRVRGFRDARESEAAALVAAVARASAAGCPVNLSDMVAATSNRIVRRVAFGDDDGDGDESMDVKAVLDETQVLLGGFWVADYVPSLRWLDALRGMRRRLERRFHQLDALYERVIDDHLNKRKATEEEDDFVDVLLRLHGDPSHRSTFGSRSHIKGILTVRTYIRHVYCRERHVGGDGAVGDDGARQEPGRARQGAARGAQRRRRRQGRRHGAGSRPPGAPLPEAGHQGDDAAAPGGAAAGAP